MEFDLAYLPIAQPHRRKPFQFAPASRTVSLPQASAVMDSMAHRNNNNVGDFPDDFKRHDLVQTYTISGGHISNAAGQTRVYLPGLAFSRIVVRILHLVFGIVLGFFLSRERLTVAVSGGPQRTDPRLPKTGGCGPSAPVRG